MKSCADFGVLALVLFGSPPVVVGRLTDKWIAREYSNVWWNQYLLSSNGFRKETRISLSPHFKPQTVLLQHTKKWIT